MAFSKPRPASISVNLTRREKEKLKRYAIWKGVSVPTVIREQIGQLPDFWFIHLEDEQPENQKIQA